MGERNVGNSGCSCGASTAPSPPPPEPAATESCTVSGRWKKSECNGKPSGKCVFQKKGKRCLRTPSNGGKCTDYRRKTCIRVGAPCSWTGGKKRGSCGSAATATTG